MTRKMFYGNDTTIDKVVDDWEADDFASFLGLWVIGKLTSTNEAQRRSRAFIGRFLGYTEQPVGTYLVFEGDKQQVFAKEIITMQAVNA